MNPHQSNSDSAAKFRVSASFIGCAALIVSFCLPWIKFMDQPVHGYQLHQLWNPGIIAWAAPVLALAAALIEIAGVKELAAAHRLLAVGAGAVPLCLFGYAMNQFGADVAKALQFGGYAMLASALFLVIAARYSRFTKAESVKVCSEAKRDETEVAR